MKTRSQKRTQSNSFLPDDIALQILPLLPFESILACKRVCKQWYNLINDPKFSKNYRHNGSMILLLHQGHLYCVLTKHNHKITRHPSYSVHRIPISFAKGINCKLLSGWSDGVACVKEANGYFHLYNLFTGASHTVKDAPLQRGLWMYCGFGYDRYDDDYKIVVVSDYETFKMLRKYNENRSDIDEVQNKENSLFWVYSSRNRCWNSFDGFPYARYDWKAFSVRNPCSFNGVLHSAVPKRKLKRDGLATKERVIVTYDLHTRRFGEISVRDDDILGSIGEKVVELDGQLCYAYLLRNTWVVEVYGVGGSWTKLLSIAHSSFVRPMPSFFELTSMVLYELGDDRKAGLFVCGDELLRCEFNKTDYQMVEACEFNNRAVPRRGRADREA